VVRVKEIDGVEDNARDGTTEATENHSVSSKKQIKKQRHGEVENR